MKIGAVGFGSRTAGVYNEFSKVNPNFEMIAYVDPHDSRLSLAHSPKVCVLKKPFSKGLF